MSRRAAGRLLLLRRAPARSWPCSRPGQSTGSEPPVQPAQFWTKFVGSGFTAGPLKLPVLASLGSAWLKPSEAAGPGPWTQPGGGAEAALARAVATVTLRPSGAGRLTAAKSESRFERSASYCATIGVGAGLPPLFRSVRAITVLPSCGRLGGIG